MYLLNLSLRFLSFAATVSSAAFLLFRLKGVDEWFEARKAIKRVIVGVGVANIVWTGLPAVLQSQAPGAMVFAGVQAVYSSASDATQSVQKAIGSASTTIKLLDTYYGNFDSFQYSLSRILANCSGCRVQILFAKSSGKFAQARGLYDVGTIDENIGAFQSRLNAFCQQIPPGDAARIEARPFDVVVPGPLYIVDDRHVFIGSYLQADGSQNAPMIEFNLAPWTPQKEVAQAYIRTFDKLWNTTDSK